MRLKIESCPFCGNSDQTQFTIVDGEYIRCDECTAYGPSGEGEEEAVRLWNKREPEHK